MRKRNSNFMKMGTVLFTMLLMAAFVFVPARPEAAKKAKKLYVVSRGDISGIGAPAGSKELGVYSLYW